MKPWTRTFLLWCILSSIALSGPGCVRKSVTIDHRAIPSSDLGRWLPQGEAETLPDVVFSTLYVGDFPAGALGGEPNAVLYQAPLPNGQMATGSFDAVGVMRFFRDGQVVWRFARKDQTSEVQPTASFGDDFTGGYVGKYKVVSGHLYMHFYAGMSKSMTGFSFITIKGKLQTDKILLVAVSRHRNGAFTDEWTTTLSPTLLMNGVAVHGMQRKADW